MTAAGVAPPAQPRVPAALVLLVVALVLLGTFLRFYQLDGKVYWHDEAHTSLRVFGYEKQELIDALFTGAVIAPADLQRFQHLSPDKSLGDTLKVLAQRPEHAPLYYLLARLWGGLFDNPVSGIRSLSALFSLLLLPALFWLARELLPDRPNVAWVVMGLVAVSPFHLLYAQDARQYTLWALASVLASAALLRAERLGRASAWWLYAATLALGFYSHLMFTVIAVVHGLYLWLRARLRFGPALRAYLLALAVAIVAVAPWLWLVFTHVDDVHNVTAWMAREVSLDRLWSGWLQHLNHLFFDFGVADARWPLGLALVLAALWRFGRAGPDPARLFLLLLAVLPAATVILPDLVLGGRRSLEARYLIPAFLALQLLVAWWLAQALGARARWRRWGAGLLGSLLAAGGLYSDTLIARADQWWNKSLSMENPAFARYLNGREHPLLISSDGDVNPGELLSLSYLLDPKVRILLAPASGEVTIPPGFTELFALNPSFELRQRLAQDYQLRPYRDSWKLWVLTPRSAAAPE